MEYLVLNYLLLGLLGLVGITVVRLRNLFGVVMLGGIYSFLSAALFLVMDAPDVAFTEAAVGAGISTVLSLGALALVGSEERKPVHTPLLPMIVVLITGAALIYGTSDMPPFQNPDNPIHTHVAPRYLEEIDEEVDIPNVVSAVLASYRGYDTMGETTVVFTAAAGAMLLLSNLRRRRRRDDEEEEGR